MPSVSKATLDFLNNLKENNHRDWMTDNKKTYLSSENSLKELYAYIENKLNEEDEIEKVKLFRINRDIRFSKDKTPYNIHRSVSFIRAGAHRRGGYYLRIESGKSMIAGGFFNPDPADLKRIRTEFQMDANEVQDILNHKDFKKVFGNTFDQSNAVKTAPKGFDKNDPNIDLIRLKAFIVKKTFTDKEIMQDNFGDIVANSFKLLRPYFDYMSDVLTTDLNGESLLK